MVKKGGKGGSGGYTWFNGWFNILVPYQGDTSVNHFCTAYSEKQDYATKDPNSGNTEPGVKATDLPLGLAKVPVDWNFNG
jgi:hypothetical protein